MPDTTDPELCPLTTNVCKPPKNFEWFYQKLCDHLGLFGLKSCHGFVILGGKIEPILFGHQNVGKYFKKNYFKHGNQQ